MVESVDVDASTVNGRVYYASGYRPRGRYVFSSHNGRLVVPVPTDQNVNVTLASFQGQVESSVELPTPTPRAKGRHPMRFTLRDGVATPEAPELIETPKAPKPPKPPRAPRAPRSLLSQAPLVPELELESFGGLIRLASQEEVLKALTKQRAKYDSLRSLRSNVRWQYDAARREARKHRHAPEAPAPPPTPEPPRQD